MLILQDSSILCYKAVIWFSVTRCFYCCTFLFYTSHAVIWFSGTHGVGKWYCWP